MTAPPRFRIDWTTEVGVLSAIEPTLDEVAAHAAELAVGYNDPNNAALMGHETPISEPEVAEVYAEMLDAGARSFLLYLDDGFVGDADLRGIHDGAAEFAFMIAAPGTQGKGLGTRFAMMVTAFGFTELGLHHVYASLVPHNTASRRVFDKLGYVVDASPAAREFADDPGDLTMGVERDTFQRIHLGDLAKIRIAPR